MFSGRMRGEWATRKTLAAWAFQRRLNNRDTCMAAIISGQTTLEQNSSNRRHRRLDRRDVPGDSSHICRSTTRHFATGAQRSREDWSGTAQPRKATDCSWQVDSWQRLLVLCKLNRGALRISRLNAARLSEFWMCGLRSVGHSSAGRIEAAGMFGAGRQGLTSCGKRLVSIPDLPKSCSAGAEARGSFCCVSGGCPPRLPPERHATAEDSRFLRRGRGRGRPRYSRSGDRRYSPSPEIGVTPQLETGAPSPKNGWTR